MKNTSGKVRERNIALADGGYASSGRKDRENSKLSQAMAMIIGVIATLEIMVAGAMILDFDFHGADGIALIFVFVVLYFGVVAILTDK